MSVTSRRAEAWKFMNEKGAVKAVLSFSGGGDEGGYDGSQLFNAEGQELAYDLDPWGPNADALALDAEAVLEDKYGGFSGEFHVSGTVVYDALARQVKMIGEEEEMRPTDTFDYEV